MGGGARCDDRAPRRRVTFADLARRRRGAVDPSLIAPVANPATSGTTDSYSLFFGPRGSMAIGWVDRPRVRALHRRRATEPAEVRDLVEPATGTRSPVPPWRARRTSTAPSRARARSPEIGARRPARSARLLHALADAIVANRAELAELEARNVGKAISSVKAEPPPGGRELPLLRLGDRVDRGRSNPIGGSLLFYSLKEPVGVAARSSPGTTR